MVYTKIVLFDELLKFALFNHPEIVNYLFLKDLKW